MFQHAEVKSEELGGCLPQHHHHLMELGPSHPPQPPQAVSSSNPSGFWRDMLTFTAPGVIKVEPRSHDQPLDGSTRIENNNFDHYQQLVTLDNKPHGLHISQHINGRSGYPRDRYQGDTSHDFDPYSSSSQMYDGGGGYRLEMQSPSTMSGGELSPSSTPPPMPRTYKPCVVCNDKSSGYHYGVSSCEGCKGFFRRSVQKNMQYTCHKDKVCVINKVTRNRCQYCRLQKCYANGMSKEAVRNDRNKKRKMKHEGCVTSVSAEDMTSEEESIISRLLKAHQDTYPSLDNDERFAMKSVEELEKSSSILWEKVSELSTTGIMRIVEFGKKVPGFLVLSTTDQITLLKAACLEIMVLRLGARYDDEHETMKFSNGISLSEKQLERGGFGTLTRTIFKFAKSLAQMNVDETEFALLSAISLMSGDRSGLENSEKVEVLQEPILEALKHYMRKRRTSQPHSFAKMLLKLTDLRSISVKGAERVLHLRLEMPGELPPLILEMLDRVENVCIP